ncbi:MULTISPECIES: hypothetical protein [Lysinibacillus]|uniref:hypothetical protein n=1 Tax=Lysinibacillus TaxID=400634 RepID=UPI00056D5F34|nr:MULTISPECIES: hypothetical protein [Lysinibacillus]
MDLLLWITIGFIIIGFIVLTSMKKGMESKVAFINEENSFKAKSVIWWIWSSTAWGIVSMFLVIWCFHHYRG